MAIWLAGSVLAVTVAVAAIGLAGARVTGQAVMVRASDRTMATILDPLTISSSTVPALPDDSVVDPTGTTAPAAPSTPSVGHPDDRLGSTPTSSKPAEAEPKDQTSEAPSTTAPASTTLPSSPSSTKAAKTVGGTVKVQCINSSVSLVSAVPASGFSVEIGNRGPLQVEVQFFSSSHQSQVSATCRGGVITFVNEESAG